jgi:hypothetical protein
VSTEWFVHLVPSVSILPSAVAPFSSCPYLAAIANAVLIFITFVLSLPAIIFPDNRGWLKLHAWFTVGSATFTLGVGLAIWFDTLRTRSNLGVVWEQQTPQVRSLLQQRVCILSDFLLTHTRERGKQREGCFMIVGTPWATVQN